MQEDVWALMFMLFPVLNDILSWSEICRIFDLSTPTFHGGKLDL